MELSFEHQKDQIESLIAFYTKLIVQFPLNDSYKEILAKQQQKLADLVNTIGR